MIFFLPFCLFLFPILSKTGHIYSQPSEIIPQNAGVASTFNLFFLLETPLSDSDFLYLKFPFPIGPSAKVFISKSLDYRLLADIPTKPFPANQKTGEEAVFFQLTQDLKSNTWYLLQVLASDTTKQTYGMKGCIFFATTSDSITETMLIYDINPCFDVISLTKPVNNINFKAMGVVANRNILIKEDFAAVYNVFFDITPNQDILEESMLILTIEKDFSFAYYCSSYPCIANDSPSSDCPINSNISQFSDFNCNGNKNTLIFLISRPVGIENIRIMASVINPNKISTSRISITFKSKDSEIWYSNITVLDKKGEEFLLVTAYSTLIKVSSNSLLFWGLKSNRLKSKTGFIGCPLYLYQTRSNVVFNSFHTDFEFNKPIKSIPESIFLRVIWRLINFKGSIATFLLNSLNTDMPFSSNNFQTSCSFIWLNASIICQNIGDLSSNRIYSISGKFSIEPSFNLEQRFLYCGLIEIQTGDGLNSIAISTGTSMGVKRNVEYIDSAINNNNNYYNQLFSYNYSDTLNYDFSSPSKLITTIKNQFIGGGSTDSTPKAAVYPMINKNNQVSALFFMLVATQNQLCYINFDGLIMSSCTKAISPTDSYAVLLKTIFNNNILNIKETEFSKGVHIIGTLFKYYDSFNNLINNGKISDYNQYNHNDNLSNFIDVFKQYNGGVFWHLSVTCKSEIYDNNPDTSCYSIRSFCDQNPISASGLGFIGTNILNYPSFYVDTHVFDFLVCFKLNNYEDYSRGTDFQDETKWHLLENENAGPGLINSYVITNTLDSLKYAFSNTYLDKNNFFTMASNTYFKANFASYIRLSFTMNNESLLDRSYVGLFLEGDQPNNEFNLFNGLAAYADEKNLINIVDFNNEINIQGQVFQATTSISPYPSTYDLWWSHHSIIFPYIDSKNNKEIYTCSVYIPVQITFSQILSFNLVIFKPNLGFNKQYFISSIYRICGSVFRNLSPVKFILPTYLSGISHPTLPLNNLWDYSNSGSGCINNGMKLPGLDSNFELIPSEIRSIELFNNPIYFRSDVSYNNISGCQISRGNDDNEGWGGLFAIYSKENIFDKTKNILWSYSGSNNKCIYHNINVCSIKNCTNTSPNFKKTLYTILCTTDSNNDSTINFGKNGNVTISMFKSPFYWGKNYPLSQTLQYLWSDPKGSAVLIQPELNNKASNWIMRNCTLSNVVSIPLNTKDAFFYLTINSKIKYKILPNESLIIRHGAVPSFSIYNISINYCYNKILSCTLSNNSEYILYNDGNETIYLQAENIFLDIYLDTANPVSTTHSAYINFGGFDIEYCSSIETTNTFIINQPTNKQNIKLSNLKYVDMKDAIGTFSFSFSINHIIKPEYDIQFNLDIWIASKLTQETFRCVILQNGKPSTVWRSLKKVSSGVFVLKSKSVLKNANSYDFQCFSIAMYNIIDSSNYSDHTISAILERSYQGDLIATSTNLNVIADLKESKVLNFSLLNKTCNTIGFDSDYIFSFTPLRDNITQYGRIILEFPNWIAPRLNPEGTLECYLDDLPAICKFIAERRVMIYPVYILEISKQYKLKILSITQSYQFAQNDNNKNLIYLALDTDDDIYNGISEYGFILDFLTFSANINPGVIFVKEFIYYGKYIRNYTSLNMILTISSNETLNNLWIKLPSEFGSSTFFSLNNIICTFSLSDNTDSLLFEPCKLKEGRKILLVLKNDSITQEEQIYSLKITNIRTPNEVTSRRIGFNVYLSSENNIIASTSVGNRNSNIYMVFFQNSRKIQLDFIDSLNFNEVNRIFVANPGFFKNFIYIIRNDHQNFNISFNISLEKNNSSDLISFFPDYLQIQTGFSNFPFQISGKFNAHQGIYIIKPIFQNLANQNEYSLPNYFTILMVLDKCSPTLNSNSLDIAYGHPSKPLIIDFYSCIPENEITVVSKLHPQIDFENSISFDNSSFMSKSLSFQKNTININFLYNVYLYIVSNSTINYYNQISIPSAYLISFELFGEDAMFYEEIESIYLNVLPESRNEPTPFITNIDNSILTLGCNQPGNIYFVIGLDDSNIGTFTITKIYNQTERKFIGLTEPEVNDFNWIIFGYSANLKANISVSINLIGKLKAGEKYSLYAFCSNLNHLNSSNSSYFTWIQSSNSGINSIINLVFNKSLNCSEKQTIACFMARIFSIKIERVWTEDGFYCNMTLQNNVSNSTKAISSNIISKFSYIFTITPDFTAYVDDTLTQVNSFVNTTNFLDKISDLSSEDNLINDNKILYSSLFLQDYSHYKQRGLLNVSIIMALTTINLFSFKVSIVMNGLGYIFVGIGYSNSTKPTFKQLFNGHDGDAKDLLQMGRVINKLNENIWFNFTNLDSNKTYSLFFAGSNFDTSPHTIFSEVKREEITTSFVYVELELGKWKLSCCAIVLILISGIFLI